jgi:hypothetical protein
VRRLVKQVWPRPPRLRSRRARLQRYPGRILVAPGKQKLARAQAPGLARTRRVAPAFSATSSARAAARLGIGGSARAGGPRQRHADLSAHAASRAHTPARAGERPRAAEARGAPRRASLLRAEHVCGRQAASALSRVPALRAARLNARPPRAGEMPERAATRRRYHYPILEVQMLYSLAGVLINNALAGVIRVLGVLASAPQLLRLALAIIGLAVGHLRLAFLAIALTFRRSTQAEEDYPARTWRDYKANSDFRKDFRFDRSRMPRLIAALDLPATARAGGYSFTADEAISVLLFALATDATLVSLASSAAGRVPSSAGLCNACATAGTSRCLSRTFSAGLPTCVGAGCSGRPGR